MDVWPDGDDVLDADMAAYDLAPTYIEREGKHHSASTNYAEVEEWLTPDGATVCPFCEGKKTRPATRPGPHRVACNFCGGNGWMTIEKEN